MSQSVRAPLIYVLEQSPIRLAYLSCSCNTCSSKLSFNQIVFIDNYICFVVFFPSLCRIHGVASGMADYALVLVNSRHPPTHMTHHHLNLCVSFGIHVIIVFTKIDGCPEHAFKDSKAEVGKLLRRPDVGKQPFEIRSEDDITTCIGKLGTLAPMISTSCVTGEGVELLQKLLFSLPKRRRHEKKLKRSFEYLVDDIFNVPGVGSVVSGFVNAGQLDIGPNAHVYVGPTDDGSFMKCVAKSAHIARINTAHVTSGQSACLALALSKDSRKKLRRGMVVLSETPTSTTSTREFEAEICVLKGEGTTIRKSYQAFVHILNVRQSAYARKIEIVDNNALGLSTTHTALYGEENEIVLRPGCRAKVTFKFAKRPVSLIKLVRSLKMQLKRFQSLYRVYIFSFLPSHNNFLPGICATRNANVIPRWSSSWGRARYCHSYSSTCSLSSAFLIFYT